MTGADPLQSAISRLEQVTERLLSFEASLAGKAVSGPHAGAPPAAAGYGAPAAANGSSNGNLKCATANGSSGGASGALAAYDKLLQELLQPFMQHATALGGEVLVASKHVQQAFQEQRTVLAVAAHAKPEAQELQSVLQPVGQHLVAAAAAEENRRSPCYNQNKVVAEALQGLSWLAYTGPNCGLHPPAQHIAECWNSAEFYANKLLKEFRGVDEVQVAWVKGLKELFFGQGGLHALVRTHMPTGLKWSPSGGSIAAAKAAVAGAAPSPPAAPPAAAAPAAAKAGGGPAGPKGPPPPPPPPANLSELLLKERPRSKAAAGAAPAAAAGGGGGGGGMQDVLNALSQGAAVTSGLRRVTDDMKAKNRADRTGHVSAAPAAKPAAAAAGRAAPASSGPPRLELQERKWAVENQVQQQEMVVNITDPKQTVYIFNCSGSVIQVKGKCNAISIDKCRKTGVVFEDVIASCELVNCSGIQVQCTGGVPTLSIDKCDGVQVYIPTALSEDPNFQVVTAKSSEVNVVLVAPDPSQEDVKEHAVPEQFISTFRGGKLITTAASHGGG